MKRFLTGYFFIQGGKLSFFEKGGESYFDERGQAAEKQIFVILNKGGKK
jgi:hypothetical protein